MFGHSEITMVPSIDNQQGLTFNLFSSHRSKSRRSPCPRNCTCVQNRSWEIYEVGAGVDWKIRDVELCHVIFPRDSFCVTWPVASVCGWVPPASAIAWNTKNHSRLAYLVICNGLLLSNALCCHVGTALGRVSRPALWRHLVAAKLYLPVPFYRLNNYSTVQERNNHIFGPVLSEVTFIFTNLV